ncbi:MAG: type VI secretion system baseplate subunit TssK [Deltaproteobacteria bacterium HGW-Deltaproteobacteria-15]|nr:MAG: type VI secretion system baseplate subunit TssK [Deltaproteobacteria bacterium HGW-Deltaproteobacteria-15]
MKDSARGLFWHQGLFLQPQHFQHLDSYCRSLLTPLSDYLRPYFWGVNRLRIEESALQSHVFELSQVEVLFRDGAWVVYPGNALLQPRPFKDVPFDFESGKPMRVYLGMKKWDMAGVNVTSTGGSEDLNGIGTRFVSPIDPEEIKDLYAPGPSAHVRFMSYLLRIFWETEVEGLGGYQLIPIGQLKVDGKEVRLSQDFVPPVVSVSASDTLVRILKDIREQVTSRCRVLEMYKLSRDARGAEPDSGFLRYLMALTSLNRYIPVLHHLTEAPVIHPWEVFGCLRQLIGELSTYTERINALARLEDGTSLLPDYNHEDVVKCFSDARVLIEELLGAIILGDENVIHLVREESRFQGHIPADAFSDRDLYCLVVRASGDREKVTDVFRRMVKVGSTEEMSILLSRALPGVPLEHRTAPLPGIPRHPDTYTFMLDKVHPQWQAIRKTGNICLYWDQAPEDTTADLVILRI